MIGGLPQIPKKWHQPAKSTRNQGDWKLLIKVTVKLCIKVTIQARHKQVAEKFDWQADISVWQVFIKNWSSGIFERLFVKTVCFQNCKIGCWSYTRFFISKSFAKGAGLNLVQKLSKLLSKSQPWFSEKISDFYPKTLQKGNFSQIKSKNFACGAFTTVWVWFSNVNHKYCKKIDITKQIAKQN